MKMTLLLVAALGAMAWPPGANYAYAQDAWGLANFSNRALDPETALTFMDILESELASQLGHPIARMNEEFPDGAAAASAGASYSVTHVVWGSLSSLGSKIVVRAAAVESATGELRGDERIVALSIEELDSVAERLASALVNQRPVEETVELGTVVEQEQTPPARRDADHGFGFQIGAVVPFSGVPTDSIGIDLGISYVYEAVTFALQPRVGVRFSANSSDEQQYVQLPVDLGAFWIAGRSDVAFLAGGGFGLRYQWARKRVTRDFDGLVDMSNDSLVTDDAVGVGTFARIGALFFRTYSVRMLLAVDYDVSFIEVFGSGFPQSLVMSLGIIL